MKVLIQGAGIAGLALGLALHKRDIDVEIVEQASEMKPLGYWMYIYDNGRRVLRSLGLEHEFDRHGVPVEGYTIRDLAGKPIHHLDFTKLTPKHELLTCIDRPALHELLYAAARPLLQIRLDTQIRSLTQGSDGVSIQLSDGTTAHYDLVVGADGVHSALRALVFPEFRPAYFNTHAWLFRVGSDQLAVPEQIQHTVGVGSYAVLYPNGPDRCGVYLAHHARPGTYSQDQLYIEELPKLFRDFGSPFREIIAGITPETELYHDDLPRIHLKRPVRGRVVIIGDAAHADSQLLGQGASLGLEDALVLAEELAGGRPVSVALRSYQSRRAGRIRRMKRLSDRLMGIVDLPNPAGAKLRDVFLDRLAPQDYILNMLRAELDQTV